MGFHVMSLLLYSYKIYLVSEAVSNAEIMQKVQMWQAHAESDESVFMQLKHGGICMSMHCSHILYPEQYIQPSKFFSFQSCSYTQNCCLLRGKSLIKAKLLMFKFQNSFCYTCVLCKY